MSGALMIQGTGSNVGKSMLVAGLCRAAKRRGLSVAPFKPQNMSNNAAVTANGGEIGRAQALQARACGLAAHTDMNPVLLKPETDVGAQVVVQGKRLTTAKARDYAKLKPTLMGAVLDSFNRLRAAHDLVIVEGAGSPAEVNLRKGDIANMGFAEAAEVPVVLCGDIDRGGVIAQIVGTQVVMPPEDTARVRGFLVNKFRGDPSLFDDGYAMIEAQTGWRGYGVAPWFPEAWRLPAEDALDIASAPKQSGFHVVCLRLTRIANFDDLDPLVAEPGVRVTMLSAGQPIPADADLVIIPGSKSTRGDLAFLRAQGWDIDLLAHHRRGGRVLGICGGYQMLGRVVADPQGLEGAPGETPGLGLLDIETVMGGDKHLTEVRAQHAGLGLPFSGYEIHIGESNGPDRARPFAHVAGTPEGAVSADGRVAGSYLHGMFSDDGFRRAWLQTLGVSLSDHAYEQSVEDTLDALADHLETHLDVGGLLELGLKP
ncbi:cobyric acid synthase [Tropicibacter naphthalenivorans]|uniref:Cobyric acid synthase n=1 Tax=Tropicibacter naphthalenivorans TaxID=441103 RepID=A0A0P1GG77_9RHOB|nr:cobyric acid synthase [Tropicibacter naphthalenivorans]CUH80840.1 Cobyric acid synthase [Tropicibacter naphthalenivorans]SMC90522.1 adenosylcobyric acid synthase (glutamine-hydrolysing) [Tropicibacter naphthalenivorans]